MKDGGEDISFPAGGKARDYCPDGVTLNFTSLNAIRRPRHHPDFGTAAI
jgi:hypothetical protein